jgi:uncharacterized protein YegP (UPF0339 family)
MLQEASRFDRDLLATLAQSKSSARRRQSRPAEVSSPSSLIRADAISIMTATFELYEDQAGQYRWRLVHENGNIIADSGEGYASRQKAEQGIESVRANAPDADVTSL